MSVRVFAGPHHRYGNDLFGQEVYLLNPEWWNRCSNCEKHPVSGLHPDHSFPERSPTHALGYVLT